MALVAFSMTLTVFAPKVKDALSTKTMDYSELVRRIKRGEVASLTIAKDTAYVELKKIAPGNQRKYKTVLPEADQGFYTLARENVKSVKIVRPVWENMLVAVIISFLLPVLLMFGLYMMIARQNALSYKQATDAGQRQAMFAELADIVEAKRAAKEKGKILLSGLTFHGYHGCLPEETESGQQFVVDVELSCDLSVAGQTDDLTKTIDYTKIYADVKRIVEGKRYHLIETVAEDIAQTILKSYPVSQVRVRVKKPQVALGGALEYVGVEVVRPTP
ncbi:MAG: dihydroneopterin aldolase [Abditibacteriales bacterium]|nr:dihydroneopterin aldolase [Abditibacteriales bacterium]